MSDSNFDENELVHVVDEREEEAKEHLGEAQDDGHLHFDGVNKLELVHGVRPDGVEPEPVGLLEVSPNCQDRDRSY